MPLPNGAPEPTQKRTQTPAKSRKASTKQVEQTVQATAQVESDLANRQTSLTAGVSGLGQAIEVLRERQVDMVDQASDALAEVLSPQAFMADVIAATNMKLAAQGNTDLLGQLGLMGNAFDGIRNLPPAPRLTLDVAGVVAETVVPQLISVVSPREAE